MAHSQTGSVADLLEHCLERSTTLRFLADHATGPTPEAVFAGASSPGDTSPSVADRIWQGIEFVD